jgi:predicted ribosomally synthesized peptide with SipW-like signal peptide
MKLTRSIAVLGGLGVAAIALIGAGASATFTQNTTSSQTITAGTLNVDVSSPGASGNGGQSITLPSTGYEPSSFMTSYTVTITNNSNIPVNEIAYQLGDSTNNGTFEAETWTCLYSDGYIYFNEPLTTVVGYGQAAEILNIPVGGTDSYTLVVYAGPTEDTGCGSATTGYSASPWTSPDGQVIPHSYTSGETYVGPAPTFGVNPAAASLTDPAEGGMLTPTFTASFEG